MHLSMPLPRHPLLANFWAFSWRQLALRRGLHQSTHPDDLYEINGVLCDRSPETHVGPDEFAVDFLVPDETPILAAVEGQVVDIHDTGFLYGPPGPQSPFADHLNYITLKHVPVPGFPEGFLTQYCHLARGCIRGLGLRRGNLVRAGQVVGYVGKTGLTTGDHLHVMAYAFTPEGKHQSTPITWSW